MPVQPIITPSADYLRSALGTTASLFGLYGIAVGLLLQMQREGRYIERGFRRLLCTPIIMLACAFVACLVLLSHALIVAALPWWSDLIVIGVFILDGLAVLLVTITLSILIFRVGRG